MGLFTKWYKIVNITPKMLKAWKDDLREDLIVWEENNKVEVRLKLNVFEALRMRRQIKEHNLNYPAYDMYLIKM